MKYIRTKDGIENVKNLFPFQYYDINGELIINDIDVNIKIDYKKLFPNNKVADTIEELCDCFVVIRPHSRGTDHYTLYRFAFVKEHCLNGDEIVYGAIWTDKGLIYVAKMNDIGELKLL